MAVKSNICRADTVRNSIEMMVLNISTTKTCTSTSSFNLAKWPPDSKWQIPSSSRYNPNSKILKCKKKKKWVSESVIAANTEYEERAPFYVLFICYVMKICWVGRLCASRWGSWGLGWGHWVTCPNITKLACAEASFWIHSLGYAFKHYVMWSIKLLINN